jgi:hypothetical protein
MKPLIACSSCPRYIHSSETACPFCGAAAPAVSAATLSLHSSNTGARRSRAASFALRSALVAGAASAAVACGGSGDIPRPEPSQGGSTAANGGSAGEDTAGNGGTASNGGTANNGGSAGAASNGGSAGTIDLADAGDIPEEEDAGAYVPIPIYGGAFPDPMTRARV